MHNIMKTQSFKKIIIYTLTSIIFFLPAYILTADSDYELSEYSEYKSNSETVTSGTHLILNDFRNKYLIKGYSPFLPVNTSRVINHQKIVSKYSFLNYGISSLLRKIETDQNMQLSENIRTGSAACISFLHSLKTVRILC